jgi:hypothetical protein
MDHLLRLTKNPDVKIAGCRFSITDLCDMARQRPAGSPLSPRLVPIKAILARLDPKPRCNRFYPKRITHSHRFAKSRLVGCADIVTGAEHSLRRDPLAMGTYSGLSRPLPPGDSRNGTKRFPRLRMPRIVPSNCRLRLDGPPVFPYSTANSRKIPQALRRPRIVPMRVWPVHCSAAGAALSAKDG